MVLKSIKEEIEEFKSKKEKFLENICSIAKRKNIKIFIFGSRVKNEYIESSDLDLLAVIPNELWKEKWKIYDELKKACNYNSFFEIHIIKEETFEEIKDIYNKLIQLC